VYHRVSKLFDIESAAVVLSKEFEQQGFSEVQVAEVSNT
jgi:hypothetical protein